MRFKRAMLAASCVRQLHGHCGWGRYPDGGPEHALYGEAKILVFVVSHNGISQDEESSPDHPCRGVIHVCWHFFWRQKRRGARASAERSLTGPLSSHMDLDLVYFCGPSA